MRERLLAGSLLLLVASGCRGRDAQAPTPTTIEEAERQLADNRRALEEAGISVPSATVAVATTPAPPPEPEGDAGDDGQEEAGGEIEPIEEVPEPEPTEPEIYEEPTYAEDAPTSAPADSDDDYGYDAEEKRSLRKRRRSRKSRRKQATRCDRMCELAEATCDLQLQICALAERHATDVRYDRACRQAQLQCDAAARECERCEI